MTLHALSVVLGKGALVWSIAGLLALAWLVPHRGFHLVRGSLGRLLAHPRLHGARRRAPRLMAFLDRHLHDSRRSWLRLVLGAAFAGGAGAWFVHLLRGVLDDSKLVVADQCLHNTVERFHSPVLWRFYSLVTTLASASFVLPLVVCVAVLFWAGGRRREALGLCCGLVGAELLSLGLKRLVERPRPPGAAQLLHDSSFPSGHTLVAASVYGFLVYLILRDEPRRPWHWMLAAPLLVLIGSVPISRIYLGVHWPYDTVASLALATAWLAILIALFKYPPVEHRLPVPADGCPWLAGALAASAVALCVYASMLAALRPQPKVVGPPRPLLPIAAAQVAAAFPAGLPVRSEDAVGGAMEPVSLLYIADQAHLAAAFARAGWQQAEPQSVHGVLTELWDVASNRPDPRGPASPTYYERQPQDLTFEKPGDPSGSIRRRHHTRLWDTGLRVSPGNLPLWVATASYDAGIMLVAAPYLLTHRIDLHVDRERDLIAGDLAPSGARRLATLTVGPPGRGTDAGSDRFFTDGRAYLLALP